MDALFFHPKVVHVPVALGMLMPLVAGGLVLAWWRAWLPRQVWWVAFALQAMLVVSGIVALQSGEADESRVERVVPERFIEAHEAAAQGFVVAALVVLAAMALAALFRSNRSALTAATLSALGSLVVLQLGYRTGQAGGELVYAHGAAQAYATGKPGTSPAVLTRVRPATDDDDDDHDSD